MPLKARVFIWANFVLGSFTVYWYLPAFDYSSYNLAIIGTLSFFAFLAEIYEIEILPRHKISVSTAIYLSMVFIGGAPLSIAVSLPAIFSSELLIRGMGPKEGASFGLIAKKVVFNTSQGIISVTAASLVFESIGGLSPPFTSAYHYIPPVITFFAFILVNISLVSGIISLSEGKSFFYQLNFNLRDLHLQFFSLGVISILIAIIYSTSPWNVFLVVILLLLVNASLKGYINLRKQAKKTFEKMMDLLSKRDQYTHEHSESVGNLTEAIAEEMKVPPKKREDIVSAARVHDIGKLGIPDKILLKEDKLTEEEWKTMKEHPVIGADILNELTIYKDSARVVRYEHERWDGSGYPEGLEGENIPLGSRIVAVADVWNALRTERPYRGPLSKEEAKAEIKDMSGDKLDPQVVDALLTVVERNQVDITS